MARQLNKLSARTVAAAMAPGRYGDGGGLYLVVSGEGRRRWVLRFTLAGKSFDMGLGSPRDVSLARARELAITARAQVASGINPIAARKQDQAVPTFGEAATSLVAAMQSQWRNEKHRAQWTMTLTEYCKAISSIPVDQITTDHVLKVLKPIWSTKPETASRLRGRIERVLDAEKALGHRTGENPALWRGHLKNLLPARQKLSRGHHAALPYSDVPAFLTELRQRQAVAALVLEFTILTACRSGESLNATWREVDLDAKVWTVSAARMKAGREHRVPLTPRALQILAEVAKLRSDDDPATFVFPGQRKGRPLSNMAMQKLLLRLGRDAITPHGFRSSFRDWAGERTTFPREVAEAALAHVIGDATERAYRRGDALEKRRKLMEAWEGFCTAEPGAKVVAIGRRRDG